MCILATFTLTFTSSNNRFSLDISGGVIMAVVNLIFTVVGHNGILRR